MSKISLYCPFQSNQRPTKCLILTKRVQFDFRLWDSAKWCTAESATAVWCTPRSLVSRTLQSFLKKFVYLTEELLNNLNISAKFKQNNCRRYFWGNFACLSGALMGSNHEKNRCRKSCDTLPAMKYLYLLNKFVSK